MARGAVEWGARVPVIGHVKGGCADDGEGAVIREPDAHAARRRKAGPKPSEEAPTDTTLSPPAFNKALRVSVIDVETPAIPG